MPMDAALRTTLVMSCQEAVIRFFAALDEGRMDDVANAMAGDGIWHRQGKVLKGPAGVSEALAGRPAGRVTAHLVHNFRVDLDDEQSARVRYLVLTYRHDFPGSAAATAPLGLPYSIAEYDDRLLRAGTTWLVQERRSRNLFINA